MGIDSDQLDRKLAGLAESSSGGGDWPEPSDIRRLARTRRTRRRGALAATVVGAVALAVVVSSGSGPPTHPNPTLRAAATIGPAAQLVAHVQPNGPDPSSALSRAVAQSEQQFSISLLKRLVADGAAPSNVVVSPSSLAVALSMLELGARGETQAQIAAALGSEGLTAPRQAAGWSALSTELAAAGTGNGIAVESANSLWMQKGLALDPRFMEDLSRYFASGVWQVDFATDPGAAMRALNAWVGQETHGRINSLFAPGAITSQTALVLANAVYFKAEWAQPFTGTTANAPFALPSGSTVSVPFMHSPVNGPLDLSIAIGPGVDAVQLPYAGSRMAALVVMPTGQSLSTFTASLSPSTLGKLVTDLAPAAVDLAMPSFSLSDSHELVPALKRLGMRDAFSPAAADLSGMAAVPLVVNDVAQKATLDVTPWGTEASAATGIAVQTSARVASVVPLAIDHPFLFLIRDTHTGAVLFEAMVENPADH